MRIQIKGLDFDLIPTADVEALEDAVLWLQRKILKWTQVYAYDCVTDTATDADGKLTIDLESPVSFVVVKPKDTWKRDKAASFKMRDALATKSGLTPKQIVKGIQSAIGPIVVEADMTPALSKLRPAYSFQVSMLPAFDYHALRLTGAHETGYALVAIPQAHVFTPTKTGTCKGAHTYDQGYIKWIDTIKRSDTAEAAFEEYNAARKRDAAKFKERMEKKAKKNGVKIKPR